MRGAGRGRRLVRGRQAVRAARFRLQGSGITHVGQEFSLQGEHGVAVSVDMARNTFDAHIGIFKPGRRWIVQLEWKGDRWSPAIARGRWLGDFDAERTRPPLIVEEIPDVKYTLDVADESHRHVGARVTWQVAT